MVIWLVQVIFQCDPFILFNDWVSIRYYKYCMNRILTWFSRWLFDPCYKTNHHIIIKQSLNCDPNVDYLSFIIYFLYYLFSFIILMVYCISILILRILIDLTLSVLTIWVPLWTYPPKRTRVSRVNFSPTTLAQDTPVIFFYFKSTITIR